MSHQHFCDFGDHYWTCEGSAVRLFQVKETVCMCLQHGTPMEMGDHSQCSTELLACAEHREQQLQAMGHGPGGAVRSAPEDSERFSLLQDADGNKIFGRCLWCAAEFKDMEEHEIHVANGMAACSVFQAFKDKTTVPPLLEGLFDDDCLPGDDDEKH